jgi:hypothetical protein
MYFHASGFKCETVYIEAQEDLVDLCGVQNGRVCRGKCDWYQIDKPIPPCEERQDVNNTEMLMIGAYAIITLTLWSWTSGIDLAFMRPTTKLRNRFPSTRYQTTFSEETNALLKFF